MRKSPLTSNRIFVAIETLAGFAGSLFSSIRTLIVAIIRPQKATPLSSNRFLELLHFVLVTGPKKFWKKPTGIGIGRSISTFLHFAFERDTRFKKSSKKGFTLAEVLVAITLLAIVLVLAMSSLGQIAFYKNRATDRIDLSRDLYSNIEQIVSYIKDGGSIDYDEYWNRNSVGLTLSWGHFALPTGFGNYGAGGVIGTTNYGSGYYYCLSGNGAANGMGTGGCLGTNYNTFGASQSGTYQRYGEYAYQFIDTNSDLNSDNGDSDADGNPLSDDDDEDIGKGPDALSTGATLPELYLLKKGQPDERIFLRYRLEADPHAPSSGPTCNLATATWAEDNGCRGTIEVLRLVGSDLWNAHSGALTSSGLYDGATDTWKCRSDFKCTGPDNLPTWADEEWVPLFNDDINVRSMSFDIYPKRDFRKNWKTQIDEQDLIVSPYVRLGISMGFSWKKRSTVAENNPVVTVSTTINLPTQ